MFASACARGFVSFTMPRIVHHTSTTPIKIDPNLKEGDALPAPNYMPWPRDEQGNLKVISICTCGVSARYPFCDGMHKVCKNEEAGKLYEYDIAKREGKVVGE